MNFENLVDQTFLENEFYELLLFELEENFEQLQTCFAHFYFDRILQGRIKITNVVFFKSAQEMDKKSRNMIEKKEWFEITQMPKSFALLLCRFDRTGFISVSWKETTITQVWKLGWADERPDLGPMTEEEIRLGFQELAGYFQNQQDIQKLGSKKAV